MGSLTFIGLGLNDERGITLSGLEAAMAADILYLEHYTSLLPELSLPKLERMVGKPIKLCTRSDLEETPNDSILQDAFSNDVVLLVPGDPMAATTHVDLNLRARKKKIETRQIHGVSIISAATSLCGLQIYKFGKTVTIPFNSKSYHPETPYKVIEENLQRELHSLVLLDVDAEAERYLSVSEGLEYLKILETKFNSGVVLPSTLAVGLARVGSSRPTVRCEPVDKLLTHDFGGPPHTLIFPGRLHFIEEDALRVLIGANLTAEKTGEGQLG